MAEKYMYSNPEFDIVSSKYTAVFFVTDRNQISSYQRPTSLTGALGLNCTVIDPVRQKYFTRAAFSRIDDNKTCFIYSKFEEPRCLSLFHKFTSKWIVCSKIDRTQQL